jgi:hypothetical protein
LLVARTPSRPAISAGSTTSTLLASTASRIIGGGGTLPTRTPPRHSCSAYCRRSSMSRLPTWC